MTDAIVLNLAEALKLKIVGDEKKTGPKGYGLLSLMKTVLLRPLLRLSSDRDLVRKLNLFPELRKICGLNGVPSNSTISRARNRIDLSDIFYQLVSKAKKIGLVNGFIVSMDSTQFHAYLDGDKAAKVGYCAAKDEYIFGYKVHIITDARSELPIAITVTPANRHDSKQFFPLIREMWKNFTCEVRKMLADSAYDSFEIRAFLREHGILDVIDRNKRRSKPFGKPKDPDYRKRVASERVNSHAKDGFVLERFTFSGLKRAEQHVFACLSAMLCSAITAFTSGIENWRRLIF